MTYRTQDAIGLALGLTIKKRFNLGYAFDYSLGDIKSYNHGSHEVMLTFKVTNKKPSIEEQDEEIRLAHAMAIAIQNNPNLTPAEAQELVQTTMGTTAPTSSSTSSAPSLWQQTALEAERTASTLREKAKGMFAVTTTTSTTTTAAQPPLLTIPLRPDGVPVSALGALSTDNNHEEYAMANPFGHNNDNDDNDSQHSMDSFCSQSGWSAIWDTTAAGYSIQTYDQDDRYTIGVIQAMQRTAGEQLMMMRSSSSTSSTTMRNATAASPPPVAATVATTKKDMNKNHRSNNNNNNRATAPETATTTSHKQQQQHRSKKNKTTTSASSVSSSSSSFLRRFLRHRHSTRCEL